LRATNVLLAGKVATVAGWSVRPRHRDAHAAWVRVIVTEVSRCALEALMDGFEVLRMRDAAKISHVIVTATGQKDVVTAEHFALAKDGCLLANAGHFNVEINVSELAALARQKSNPRPNVEEYVLADGRRLRLLAEGRLVNLAAAEGHPATVMDMSFANQALCAEFLAAGRARLEPGVHDVPLEIDQEVARLKLAAIGTSIDVLTAEQLAHASSWQAGT
jgi:adenosylhomocysteinase